MGESGSQCLRLSRGPAVTKTEVTQEVDVEEGGLPPADPSSPFHLPPTILVVCEKVCTWVVELENSMDTCSCSICLDW